MLPLRKDLAIHQGKTFVFPVKWETEPIVYKAITGITQAAPCVVSSIGHGVPDGWRVAIVSVKGMTQINAANTPPRDADYYVATVTGADALTLNEVNSSDFKAWTSGGYIQYNTPKDLAGHSARMLIKDKVGGTTLLELSDANHRIVLDNTTKTITLNISAADTEQITWKKGVYDLELIDGDVVTALLYGAVTVTKEVTTAAVP